MNLIAIDIGNSSISMGFFTEAGLVIQKMDTRPLKPSSEYAALIKGFIKEKNIDKIYEGVIISSVVPGHTEALEAAGKILCRKEPLILAHKLNTGIDFQINEPEKLGADRIAASAGACNLFGAPVAVADFGTATTLNFIGSGNVYKGGAIMPGIGLMEKALFKEAAQLPDIELSMPLTPLGKDTTGNILSGIIYGTAGAVDRIIAEVEGMGGERFKVVITGGNAELVAPFLKRGDYIEPFLVLKGLKYIYGRNS
ncbi:MAG: type III pantothenate kinase [Nitrospirae bacterium]|nr:MAG: type III pantothenate kinase [Nitrospirota bacterium]